MKIYNPNKNFHIYFATFVLTSAVIIYEICLIRITLCLFSGYGSFIAISLSFLGLGLGNSFVYWRTPTFANKWTAIKKALLLFILSTVMVLPSFLFFGRHIFTSSLSFRIDSLILLCLCSFLMGIPLIFLGYAIALIFTSFTHLAFKIYAVDLFSTCFGIIFVWFTLQFLHLSPANIIYLLVFFCSVALLLSIIKRSNINTTKYFFLTAITLTIFLINSKYNFVYIFPLNSDPSLEYSDYDVHYWDSYAYIRIPKNSVTTSPPLLLKSQNEMGKSIKVQTEDFSTLAVQFNKIEDVDWLKYNLSSYSFFFGNKGSAIILGSGAGRDIAVALAAGYKKVTGVEIVPAIVKLVKKRLNEYTGYIYDKHSKVSIYIDNARNYLQKHTENKYDNITLVFGDSSILYNRGVLLGSKSFLLTKEAFELYLARLNPGGIIFIPENAIQKPFVLATLIKAALAYGIPDPQDNILLVGENKNWIMFFKNSIDYSIQNKAQWIKQQYGHSITAAPWLNNDFVSHIVDLVKKNLSVRIQTDNNPFLPLFYKDYNTQEGRYFIKQCLIWTAFLLSIIAIMLFSPFYRYFKRDVNKKSAGFALILFFSFIGLSYMITSVGLIYKTMLLIGNPFHAFLIVLPLVLVFSGLGSLLATFLKITNWRINVSLLCVFSLLTTHFIFNYFLKNAVFFNTFLRFLLMYSIVATAGFFIGLPFPSILSLLREKGIPERLIAFYISVDSYFSVVGSIVIIYILSIFGLEAVLPIGGLLYFFAWLALCLFARQKSFYKV